MIHGKMLPCQASEALVAVSSYKDGALNGYLLHPRLKETLRISSLPQLLLVLDDLLDMSACPASPPPLVDPLPKDAAVLATFRINVLFREAHTWQGRLIWIEQGQEGVFHSVLELIGYLDDILSA